MQSPTDPSPGALRWFGLDALRALAIAMVMLYHLNLAGVADGGFLGVDLFFVISGFLITALLLAEHQRSGRLALASFFLRRFHRLFPPFALMVVVCTWLTPLLAPGAYARLVADLPFSFYLANWWQIYSQQSYFEGIDHPRVLQHLWSLAVEEQYYLVWPVVLGSLLARNLSRTLIGCVCLFLALLSTLAMAYFSLCVVQGADPSRMYFGSDTHVMGLFIGAATACWWNPAMRDDRPLWVCRDPHVRLFLAVVTLVALLWMGWSWHDQLPFMYLGGFAVFSACSAFLIVLVTDPAPVLRRGAPLLRPLRALTQWTGTRSYSLYLWHWPIFMWISAQHAAAPMSVVQRVLATALAAECSYRVTELPWKRAVARGARMRRSAAVALAFVVSASFAVHSYAPDTGPAAAAQAADNQPAPDSALESPGPATSQELVVPEDSYTRFDTQGQRTLVLGDSVMLGARGALLRAFPNAYVDAEVGRQASQGLGALELFVASHKPPDLVVVHLGTNGYIYEKHLRQILAFLRNSTRVVVVNNCADRRWTDQNNALIQKVIADFDNVRLVDWNAIGHENMEYFVADGVHLSSKGMRRFVHAIGEALSLEGTVIPATGRSKTLPPGIPAHERQEAAAGEAQALGCAAGESPAMPAACSGSSTAPSEAAPAAAAHAATEPE